MEGVLQMKNKLAALKGNVFYGVGAIGLDLSYVLQLACQIHDRYFTFE